MHSYGLNTWFDRDYLLRDTFPENTENQRFANSDQSNFGKYSVQQMEYDVMNYVETHLIGRHCDIQQRIRTQQHIRDINTGFVAIELKEQTVERICQRDNERLKEGAKGLNLEHVLFRDAHPLEAGMF